MSSNGNGDDEDDNIDELIDEFRNTNKNLEDLTSKLDTLINSIIRGAERGEETADEFEKIDLWDEGTRSPGKASSPEGYIELRRLTARNENISVPQIDRSVNDMVSFFVTVYRMFGEHLQRIFYALNKDQWERFVQEIAILYGVDRKLVNILDPGPDIFGVSVTDKEVDVFQSATHMNFTEAYNNIWFSQSIEISSIKYSGPSDALQLIEDEDARTIEGLLEPRDINSKMAKAIANRNDLSLPDEYLGLL